LPLERLGKYERLDVLGHGASGIVYLAKDTLLGKQVALKEISAQGDEKERFLEEARVLDRLHHPNIVQVNSVDEIGGRVVIDMEYVRGRNLQEVLRETPALPIPQAVSIAAQICDGLAYAHSQRTVHRDIKPANILITRDGTVKLVDFGLAEVLGTHSFAGGAGTYAYMAPEDFHPEEQSDRQSDIWAVGVILYEMLVGRRPFQVAKSKDPFAWKTAIESDPIPVISELRPDVPPTLDAIAVHALARDKADRYRDAGNMAADLRELFPAGTGTGSAGLLVNESPYGTTESSVAERLSLPSRPELSVPGAFAIPSIILPGFPPGMADIETFLALAPDHWDAARSALQEGTLSSWLRSINEEPLAAVADEVASEPERDSDDTLRDFLYRAGVETAEDARQAYSEAQMLAKNGRHAEAAALLRRAGHLDPIRYGIELAAPESVSQSISQSTSQSVPQRAAAEEAAGLTLSRDSVDFGVLRRGQSRKSRVMLQTDGGGGGGRLEGRVSAAPGWVRVEPSSFSAKRRQMLTLTTETDTVWSAPATYQDSVTLETSVGRRTIAVSARILPARLSWLNIAVWYWPLLLCAGLPVAASIAGRFSHPPVQGIQQPGFAAGGLLFLSAFLLSLAADTAWGPRLLPLALSGLLFWRLSLMLGYGSARTHLLFVQTVTPVLVLLVLQTCAFLLDASGWGNWKLWRWIVPAVGLLIGYSLLHSG
jgi:serine/threonine protein kinase